MSATLPPSLTEELEVQKGALGWRRLELLRVSNQARDDETRATLAAAIERVHEAEVLLGLLAIAQGGA